MKNFIKFTNIKDYSGGNNECNVISPWQLRENDTMAGAPLLRRRAERIKKQPLNRLIQRLLADDYVRTGFLEKQALHRRRDVWALPLRQAQRPP